ncbi:hypothetical protein [Niveibacterium sp. SC-1]|uniref:hypothetical protein n=1 Tax=Niveibacterium sp. SC-1 TaxID=3135646 RepID=UPI00311F5725
MAASTEDFAQRLTFGALYAITRFIEHPSPERAAMVARHLECVAEQAGEDKALQDLCSLLAMRWRGWIPARLAARTAATRH